MKIVLFMGNIEAHISKQHEHKTDETNPTCLLV
jgi:hypothetical protein